MAAVESRLLATEQQLTEASQVVAAQKNLIEQLQQAAIATSVAPTASAAPPPAQAATTPLVDTRQLGKPNSFSGELDASGKPQDNQPWQ